MQKSTVFVFLSAVFFSLGGLFFKITPWDALAISSARSILAAVCIGVFLCIRRHRFRITRSVIAAALAITITNSLYAVANKLTTAGNAIVLQFSMPAFVILIMLVVYRKKPTRLELATCAAVLAGILCFFVDSLSTGNTAGDLMALIAGATYACFFIFNSREDSEPFTAIMLSYALTALIGLPSLLRTDIAGSAPQTLLAVAALGFLQQGAGQIFLALGIRQTSPVTAGLISGIEPILNPILVAVFYHEMLSPLALLGAGIVLVSVMGYNYRTASRKESPAAS